MLCAERRNPDAASLAARLRNGQVVRPIWAMLRRARDFFLTPGAGL
jgi:hypothetical protein